MLAPWKKSYDQPRQHIKKQRHYFADKGLSSQSCGFSSSHVWMWELNCEESWALKNGCFCPVVLEKTLESPLDCKEIQPVHPKGSQSWIFIGRTDAEAETPVLWPPDVKNWLLGKDPDAGKDWRQEEKGTTEDEMVGWHHQLEGHEFEQAPGVGDGQGSLACCSPRGRKESDTTERLNWTELNEIFCSFSYQVRKPYEYSTPLTYVNLGAPLIFVLSCSVMSDSFVTPWTVAPQAPLSMGILQARILEWGCHFQPLC